MKNNKESDLYFEANKVISRIDEHGCNFEKHLADLISVSDYENILKIKYTWPDIWDKYLLLSRD